MSNINRRGGRISFKEKATCKRKADLKRSLSCDTIQDAIRFYTCKMGFTRETVLKHLVRNYEVLDQKTVTKQINVALRNGLKNNTLKLLSGTGTSGRFRCVAVKSKPSPKGSKDKTSTQMQQKISQKEMSAIRKTSEVNIKKTHNLRKRKPETAKVEIKSRTIRTMRTKQTSSRTTGKTSSSNVHGAAGKKKLNRRLKSIPVKNTTDPKSISSRIPRSKPSSSEISATATYDPKETFSQVPESEAIEIKNSLMHTSDRKSTSPETPFDILESLKEAELDRKTATDDLQIKVILQRSSIQTKMEPSVDLFGGGMVVLNDGRKLIADHLNIMLYSSDMKLQCIQNIAAREVPERTIQEVIKDIAIFNETVVIVMLYAGIPKIKFVNISPGSLSLSTQTVNLKTYGRPNGITSCRGYIYFTTIDTPPSVKKIDSAGEIYWSVSNDHEGKDLFCIPYCIDSFVVSNSVRLVVTDACGPMNVTLLDGESGDVLFVRQGVNCMRSLTTDPFKNIYICYGSLGLVSVMKSDLSEEKIILTTRNFCATKYSSALAHDLQGCPQQIAFDHKSNALVVTNGPLLGNPWVALQIYKFLKG